MLVEPCWNRAHLCLHLSLRLSSRMQTREILPALRLLEACLMLTSQEAENERGAGGRSSSWTRIKAPKM